MKIFFILVLFIITSPNLYAKEAEDRLGMMCDNLSAEYKSGVDVHGNEVVNADLDSKKASILIDPMIIPLRIDLIKRFDLDAPDGSILEPIISNIEIYADGQVKYNGEEIDVSVEQLCEFHAKSINNLVQEHGQEAGNTVMSSDKNN